MRSSLLLLYAGLPTFDFQVKGTQIALLNVARRRVPGKAAVLVTQSSV